MTREQVWLNPAVQSDQEAPGDRRSRARGPVRHHPRPPPRLRQAGIRPALLLLHGLGCDHTTWEPVIDVAGAALHGDRPRPARARRVGQAARRLQRRRLRQRHARPAHRARHRQGDRGRATASAAAWRCSSPTSSPSAPSGWCWSPPAASAPRSRRLIRAITTPGFHQVDGPADPARRPARRQGRPARRCRAPPLAADPRPRRGRRRSTTPSRTRHARAAIRHVVRAVVDWQRPDRHHGRPGLPHRGDADVRHLGHATTGDPGPPRRATPPRSPPARGSR